MLRSVWLGHAVRTLRGLRKEAAKLADVGAVPGSFRFSFLSFVGRAIVRPRIAVCVASGVLGELSFVGRFFLFVCAQSGRLVPCSLLTVRALHV